MAVSAENGYFGRNSQFRPKFRFRPNFGNWNGRILVTAVSVKNLFRSHTNCGSGRPIKVFGSLLVTLFCRRHHCIRPLLHGLCSLQPVRIIIAKRLGGLFLTRAPTAPPGGLWRLHPVSHEISAWKSSNFSSKEEIPFWPTISSWSSVLLFPLYFPLSSSISSFIISVLVDRD